MFARRGWANAEAFVASCDAEELDEMAAPRRCLVSPNARQALDAVTSLMRRNLEQTLLILVERDALCPGE